LVRNFGKTKGASHAIYPLRKTEKDETRNLPRGKLCERNVELTPAGSGRSQGPFARLETGEVLTFGDGRCQPPEWGTALKELGSSSGAKRSLLKTGSLVPSLPAPSTRIIWGDRTTGGTGLGWRRSRAGWFWVSKRLTKKLKKIHGECS